MKFMIAAPKRYLAWHGVVVSVAMHAALLALLLTMCQDFPHRFIHHQDRPQLVGQLISPSDLSDGWGGRRVFVPMMADHQGSITKPKLHAFAQMAEISAPMNRLPATLHLAPKRVAEESPVSKTSFPAPVAPKIQSRRRRPERVNDVSMARRGTKAYAAMLEEEVKKALRYPRVAEYRGRQGTALIKVRLGDNGHIEKVTLIRSSGSKALDDEARAVFRRINPLPPFHVEGRAGNKNFKFLIPVTFRLDSVGRSVAVSQIKHRKS